MQYFCESFFLWLDAARTRKMKKLGAVIASDDDQ